MVTPQSDQSDLDDRDEQSAHDSESSPQPPTPKADADPDDRLSSEEAESADADTLEEPLPEPEEDLQAQLEEAEQRALRHQAELENSRKRMRREMEDQTRYAALPLMRDLLPALDNLRRAIESAEPTDANQGLLSGVQMVCEQLQNVLAKHQCSQIEAEGTAFDPNLHEAVVQQPSSEYPPGTVIKEIQTGYQLLDRIVRPSQVMVAQLAEIPQDDDPNNQQEEDK